MEYKFFNSKTKYNSTYNLVQVKTPHDYLSMIFEGNESLGKIQKLIDEITKVKNGELEDFYFGNDNGFSAVAAQANPDDKTEGEEGVYIYDAFGKEPETALFIVPLDDMLKLLKEFKEFLGDNKR